MCRDLLPSLWPAAYRGCKSRPSAPVARAKAECAASACQQPPPRSTSRSCVEWPRLNRGNGVGTTAALSRDMKTNRRVLIIAFSCLTGGLASASFGQPAPSKATAPPSKGSYQVDAKKSRFIVETETTGLSAMFAHDHKIGVRVFTGQATFTRDGAPGASLTLTVDAKSLYLLGEKDIGERQAIEAALREDVLETASAA